MKSLILGSIIGFLSMAQVYAGAEVIGETKHCSIQAKVIQVTTDEEDYLQLAQDHYTYTLAFIGQIGSIKHYASPLSRHASGNSWALDAFIMGKEMSVLSQLKIHDLSGVSEECEIEAVGPAPID
ncbi:MAG: hypothetical protein ACXVLQ_09380 [Bacteriovorax sp.]